MFIILFMNENIYIFYMYVLVNFYMFLLLSFWNVLREEVSGKKIYLLI